MRVALDLNPLTVHKGRGIGFYTQRLSTALVALAKQKKDFSLTTFKAKLPPVDLIHLPGFTLFSKPTKAPSLPLVITVHDLIPLDYPKHFPLGLKGKLIWYLQKKWLRLAKAIITDSKASKKSIIKHTGIDAKKIHVIYLAADKIFTTLNSQTRLKAIQKRYQLPDKFVLYVGDLNWNKNIIALSNSCLKLNLPLVVIGKQTFKDNYDRSHPENQDLRTFQSMAKTNPNQIIRIGFVPTSDLVAIYNLATIYAQPSRAEGFGLPILEAFACGCPVITSKFTSTEEIAGQAALLINPNKDKELSSALKKLWNNPALRTKLSKLGLKQAKLFTWEKTAQQTYAVYQQALR
jgi:glycosyltransferase involved in cell wall biosynthesis